MSGEYKISAALVAGPCRSRAQRVIDSLCSQTAVDSMEIIVVDLAPLSTPRLRVNAQPPVVYLSRPDVKRWGRARTEVVKTARAPIVAFIEDHCFPSRTWAEK